MSRYRLDTVRNVLCCGDGVSCDPRSRPDIRNKPCLTVSDIADISLSTGSIGTGWIDKSLLGRTGSEAIGATRPGWRLPLSAACAIQLATESSAYHSTLVSARVSVQLPATTYAYGDRIVAEEDFPSRQGSQVCVVSCTGSFGHAGAPGGGKHRNGYGDDGEPSRMGVFAICLIHGHLPSSLVTGLRPGTMIKEGRV